MNVGRFNLIEITCSNISTQLSYIVVSFCTAQSLTRNTWWFYTDIVHTKWHGIENIFFRQNCNVRYSEDRYR